LIFGVVTATALIWAELELQPAPWVGTLALDSVSVLLLLLHVPVTEAEPLGASVTTQPDTTLEENVTPALGITRDAEVADVQVIIHFPLVLLVFTVSVPERLSVQPPNVGVLEAVMLTPFAGVLPARLILVQVTEIWRPSITPEAVRSVPGLSLPVTAVLAGVRWAALGEAKAPPVAPKHRTPASDAAARNFVVRESIRLILSLCEDSLNRIYYFVSRSVAG
jgi:hypothetical protein